MAVVLAVLAAVLFGLAAVRHHGAVQETMGVSPGGLRQTLASFWKLVRHPRWLVGSVQVAVAGALHFVSLAMAPIALIQPIGVLAVPVTVVAAAVVAKRRPSRAQIIGCVLSVVGVALLTLLLLTPTPHAFRLPSPVALVVAVAVTAAAAFGTIVAGARIPRLVRCLALATTSAVLFGLNAILIRTMGHLVATRTLESERPVLVAALLCIAVALPVGLWTMQTAYVSGSPHLVVCCLALLDPLAAVIGGNLLLHDGMVLSTAAIVGVVACSLLAAVGVVFLSHEYPDELLDPAVELPGERAPARST
jgi:drug/metabolite transporter (DMT)-like permease